MVIPGTYGLTNTVNGTPQTYTYFKNGSNPLNGQRLSSDSVNAYTYDANGNDLTRNGTPDNFTFGWDTDDRMTSISGSATANYSYDYQGRRASKTVPGSSTSYLYDGPNPVQAAGSTTTAYLFGPGIDEPLATVQSGGVSYFTVDGLGSAHLLTGGTGTVDNAYLYDAWGVAKSQTASLANDFGYTAREFGEAGLWYYRARYYQADVGRFGSEDPIRSGTGPGSYPYAANSPTLVTDASGQGRFWNITKELLGWPPEPPSLPPPVPLPLPPSPPRPWPPVKPQLWPDFGKQWAIYNRCNTDWGMDFLFGASFTEGAQYPRTADQFDTAFGRMCAMYATMHPGYTTHTIYAPQTADGVPGAIRVDMCCGKCP